MFSTSTTACGRMAYFRPNDSRQVHAYNSDTEEWSTLPECPSYHFTLTVIDNLVTAVGGSKFPWYVSTIEKLTNTLLSLMQEGQRKNWVGHFPPMPTKRKLTAVVCNGKALVVAGGEGEGCTTLATVEVMDTDTLLWSTTSSLLQPLYNASATVCGDRVYLGGGFYQHGYGAKSVLTCSLSALIQPQEANNLVWSTLEDLLVDVNACITLNGQLLAVGSDSNHMTRTNIYTYNTKTNSWDIISHMPTPRYQCLLTVLPGNKLIVVGGCSFYSEDMNKVEIAIVRNVDVLL